MSKNKIYHLSSCSTCKKILGSLDTTSCELQDIKQNSITAKELDHMAKLAGSYEALFSRRAIQYRTLNLKDKKLTEKDYRKFILQEYTFLKRPVVIVGKQIFIGNIGSVVKAAQEALSS